MVNQEKNFGLLCEDLLVNIFCRLHVKDLLKCKCVSKEWLTVVSQVCIPMLSAKDPPVSGVYYRAIRDRGLPYVTTTCPQDKKKYLQHLVAYSDSIHYVDSAPLEPHFMPFSSARSYSDEKADSYGMSLSSLLPFDHRGANFLDCCNGLVLFVQRPKPLFYVCNPVIGQCVSVPPPPPSIQLSSLYASLAFDPSESIHYRVVISSLSNQPQCIHLFDSQTGEWKSYEVKIELPPFAECFKLLRHSIYLRGVVHRLSMYGVIISFDLKCMKACVINCPSQKSPPAHPTDEKDQPPPGCIGVSNGSLCYVRNEDGYVCVWLLDNPNDSSEWSLKHKIFLQYLWKYARKNDWSSRYVWLRCCSFHPTSDILFMGSASSIFMYHIGSDLFEAVRYLNFFESHCGDFFPLFLHKNVFVTLKDWSRGITNVIDNYEDIHDRWCYTDQ
ncbi:F-box protein At5g62510-like [Chenopodium quinoa]|uniref:F-box protein At5g62510-like n=1 Tax=Chenopodium quinoa TaxID=63459 RepID=UPI000B773FF8|nr:F-box protein At5g62510-like [Chenopodium quinoa]